MKANGIARRSTTLAGAALLLLGVTAAAAQDAGSQNGALNTIPRNEGFGAANAGGTVSGGIAATVVVGPTLAVSTGSFAAQVAGLGY